MFKLVSINLYQQNHKFMINEVIEIFFTIHTMKINLSRFVTIHNVYSI